MTRWALLLAVVVATTAHADDSDPARSSATPSRALPIALLAVGAPMLVGGVIGIAIDEDEAPSNGPTFMESAPAGTVAIVGGGLLTAIGAYLYLGDPPPVANHDRTWMKWTGASVLGVSALVTVLGITYERDRKQANRDYTAFCEARTCLDPGIHAIEDRRDRAETRRDIAFMTGGALAVGGLVLFLSSRPAARAAPQLQVGAAGAGLSWSSAF